MKRFLFYGLTALFITNSSFAQTQNVTLGQSNQINIAISNTSNTAKCHIEVTLPNQQKVGVDVDAPQFNAVVDFTPDQIGNSVLKWEGKIKRRGLNSVLGCTGSGSIQVTVIGNSEFISQQWIQYFAKAPEVIAECVKVGMDLSQLKYQSLSDPNTLLTGPDDQKLKPIYDKCDAFAKQTQPRKGTPCTIPNQNNLKTTCDGVYAERQTDGRLKSISRSTAIQLQFEGKPWTIGLAESLDVRTTRLKQEEEEKIKQGAIIASQKEIEEKERKLKESPEYKKQQAELERKRIADEREASLIKAKKEQEAELKTKKNFLLGLCEIPHKSSLSDCSLDAIARMDGTVGSFSIYQEDKLSFIVRSSNKLPANLAVNQDFNVPIKYEIDEKSNRITTIVTNTTGNCLTRTNYEFRNDKTIIVSKGSLSQGCGDFERAIWNRTEPAFEMKFRRIK
jgi:hypothetical protein